MVEQKKVGITSLGAYLPYYYFERSKIGEAWGTRGKGKKAICNSDEDSITMAVEAGLDTFRYLSRNEIGGLFFASTTVPYAEKSNATLISTVLDLNENVTTADYNSSMRSATAALRGAYMEVKAGETNNVLVVASDKRNGYPKSDQESHFADGAAAVVVGTEHVVATIDAFATVQTEIVDMWRNIDDTYVRNAEGRFIYESGYLPSVKKAVEKLFEDNNLTADDFEHIVFVSIDERSHLKAAKKLKLDPEKIVNASFAENGVLGASQPLFHLVQAIERANAGERILVVNYGNGADAIALTVTDEKEQIIKQNSTDKYLDNRASFNEYGRFLSFRGIIEAKPGEDYKIPGSTSQTWREQETYLKLYGSKCNECGNHIFPQERICYHCRSLDNFEKVNKQEEVTTLFTYSIDNLAGRSDDPVVVQSVVEDQHGTRFYMNMTDFDVNEVGIDMELEFTLRKIHNLANFPNYYWKVRPLRRKVD
ncbi:3-oxoacyl-[acyl-carrier-protein] synthase III C-terminal domain-containing protein [Fundicoccus culcitae]|uniref:3-hydroxy-3-methylglutaryl CoA synthase n=1 Tax=Fundicoccus culcitae TaxID=2969821 RepID=A0ABY5P9Q3_9LACT|nr:3-oxoacyl-[acyl-carrier-protein] synthase III C-terminal domain-containing protein [Fundicoccus culcitae]UUX35085.1 hypothetical protein NRE15_05435 [Fundicoccus culcitae]